MKKEFIPYEQALALKELGFDEPCFATHGYLDLYIGSNDGHIKAPTFSQGFRWFREKYNLFGHIEVEGDNSFYWHIRNPEQFISSQKSNTYEEAELECLKKLIEIIKQK
jgi:hypothetical protein